MEKITKSMEEVCDSFYEKFVDESIDKEIFKEYFTIFLQSLKFPKQYIIEQSVVDFFNKHYKDKTKEYSILTQYKEQKYLVTKHKDDTLEVYKPVEDSKKIELELGTIIARRDSDEEARKQAEMSGGKYIDLN